MEFVSLKSLSMMLLSSPNSLQSFDSAKVINIHEPAELIGPSPCIIAGDWSEVLRLGWTRAGEAAGSRERRVRGSRPGLAPLRKSAPSGAHNGPAPSPGRPRPAARRPPAPRSASPPRKQPAPGRPAARSPSPCDPRLLPSQPRGPGHRSPQPPPPAPALAALGPLRSPAAASGAPSRALGGAGGGSPGAVRPGSSCPAPRSPAGPALAFGPGEGWGPGANSLTRPPGRRRRSLGPARMAPGPAGHSRSRRHRSD